MNIQIAAEKLFYLWKIPVTNTLFTSWIVAIFLILASQVISRNMKKIPGMFQNISEWAIESLAGFMEKILGSRKKAEQYFPLIATIFILVLVSNWFGIFPGMGSVGFYRQEGAERIFVPLTRSVASDLNFTVALAVLSVVLVNVAGMRALGFKVHLSKYFNFSNPIKFFVGILELVGEFAKMISFSFRLFGNVFAGEVLLIITGFLAPYIIPIPFLILEIFVGFIQALVFSMLSLVFVSIAVEHEH